MGVGPPHTIEEVTEGDEVMEKRGRQDGITTEQAKGRTQRWQPLLPNLQRVNEAARNSGQTRFTALLHHVDVAALERGRLREGARSYAKRGQWYSPVNVMCSQPRGETWAS